jgi:hypothetical protein
MLLLLKGKTSKEVDRASKEACSASKEAGRAFKKAVGASEEAGKGGGGRKREERGKEEEEAVDSTASSPVTMINREAFFKTRRENGENILDLGVFIIFSQ